MTSAYWLFLLSCLSVHLYAQPPRDVRARITPNARIEHISVLDDESIWLGTMAGELYYTKHFEKNWHYALRNTIPILSPQFSRVVSFDNGVILVVGQITEGSGYGPNAIIRSADHGKTWRTISFTSIEKFLQVHAVDHNKKGEVWLSGGPARFFYSNDFGESWEEKTSPYAPPMRVYGIDMLEDGVGFISTHAGKISHTTDNGKNWSSVPTPFDQKIFTPTEAHWTSLQVDKISACGDYLIARQGDRVYFSSKDAIRWRVFPDTLTNFSVDRTSQQLIGVSRKNSVIFYDQDLNPTSLNRVSEKQFVDIQAVGGKLYALDGHARVYRITRDKIELTGLFTDDFTITTPNVTHKGTAVKWGIDGHDIFNTAYDNLEWYRVRSVDFTIKNFRLLNDSEAILWDGNRSYYYNRNKDSLVLFHEKKPLEEFLAYKIDSIKISTSSSGCFHFERTAVGYTRKDDRFVMTASKKKDDDKFKMLNTGKELPYSEIVDALRGLNINPSEAFTLHDLSIDNNVRNSAMAMLRESWKEKESYSRKKKKTFDETHFLELIKSADTLSQHTIRTMMLQREGWSTTSNMLHIRMTNSAGKILTFLGVSFTDQAPYFLAWEASQEETNFAVTSLPLARAIDRLMPQWMLFKNHFKDDLLLFSLIRKIDGF